MQTTNPSLMAGVFRDQAQADSAIDELKQAGFRADQIKSTVYNLNAMQGTQDSTELVPEQNRIVVTVLAEGREQDAVGIFANNGGNNADLPAGIVLVNGALVSSQTETGTVTPDLQSDAATGFSSDSFFQRERVPGQPEDTAIMDNMNFPHG